MSKAIKKSTVLVSCMFLAFGAAGCSEDTESYVSEQVSETVEESFEEEAETIEVIFYNDTDQDIISIVVEPADGEYEAVEVGDGDPIEPEVMYFADVPYADSLYRVKVYTEDGQLYGEEMDAAEWDFNNSAILILTQEYAGEQMLYSGDWGDIDDAIAAAHGIDPDAESEPSEEEQMIQETLAELGYDSIEWYRTVENDYVDDSEDDPYFDVSGYWYPEDDRTSLTYFKIQNGTVYWYTFEEGKGDVETSYDSITSYHGKTYKTYNGNQLVFESDNLFSGHLLYNDGETKYYHEDH